MSSTNSAAACFRQNLQQKRSEKTFETLTCAVNDTPFTSTVMYSLVTNSNGSNYSAKLDLRRSLKVSRIKLKKKKLQKRIDGI